MKQFWYCEKCEIEVEENGRNYNDECVMCGTKLVWFELEEVQHDRII